MKYSLLVLILLSFSGCATMGKILHSAGEGLQKEGQEPPVQASRPSYQCTDNRFSNGMGTIDCNPY